MMNGLESLMYEKSLITLDNENTMFKRRYVLRFGLWKAVKHLWSTGRWERLDNIIDLYRNYKNDNSEEVTNLLMKVARGMDASEVNDFGMGLGKNIRRTAIYFLERYDDRKRTLLTRDPYMIARHTLSAMEDIGIPFHEYVTSDAVVEDGRITGELGLRVSDGVRGKLGTVSEHYNPPRTSEDKLWWYEFLVEDVFRIGYDEALYVHDNGKHEQDIIKKHSRNQISMNDLDVLMKPYMPSRIDDIKYASRYFSRL